MREQVSGSSSNGRSLREGFEGYYRPADVDWRLALSVGVVVLDANVLLDAYRFSAPARADLLATLESIKPRLFVPHQVALEYHRNRARAVDDRRSELANYQTRLSAARDEARSTLQQLGGRSTFASTDAAMRALHDAFGQALELVGRVANSYDLDANSVATGDDELLPRLEYLFEGSVGPPPTSAEVEADTQEADRRRRERVAPGFKDEAGGDYFMWKQSLRYVDRVAPEARKAMLIVTNDVAKKDWTHDVRGFRLGPALSLIEEAREVGIGRLMLATVPELLSKAQELGFSKPLRPETVTEADAALRDDKSRYESERRRAANALRDAVVNSPPGAPDKDIDERKRRDRHLTDYYNAELRYRAAVGRYNRSTIDYERARAHWVSLQDGTEVPESVLLAARQQAARALEVLESDQARVARQQADLDDAAGLLPADQRRRVKLLAEAEEARIRRD